MTWIYHLIIESVFSILPVLLGLFSNPIITFNLSKAVILSLRNTHLFTISFFNSKVIKWTFNRLANFCMIIAILTDCCINIWCICCWQIHLVIFLLMIKLVILAVNWIIILFMVISYPQMLTRKFLNNIAHFLLFIIRTSQPCNVGTALRLHYLIPTILHDFVIELRNKFRN